MAERVVGSTALSAKGRVRVSKHSAEELARLGRDDGVDSGSEASGCSSGEEDKRRLPLMCLCFRRDDNGYLT